MTSVHASLRKALILGIASTAGFIGMQTAAHAEDQVPQVRVRYSTTQLNDTAEAHRLYERLRSAANAVCQQFDNKQLHAVAMKKECVAIALDRAVHDVNHSAVLALHQKSDALRVAQKNGTSHPRG